MNRISRILTGLLLLAISACGSGPKQTEYQLSGGAMGTRYNISLVAPPDNLDRAALQGQIAMTLEDIENLASTYRPESELSLFNANQSTDWIVVPEPLCNMIEQALALSAHTAGAFDITVGPLVNLWGFGPDKIISQPPDQQAIDAALARVGHSKLETRCSAPAVRKARVDLYVDLSGWAKGYAVDQLAILLDASALTDYLIEVGGEVRVRGHNAKGQNWIVAIEKPLDTQRAAQTVLHLTDYSVATSGDYRNYFEYDGKRYSHTIDARTGRPVAHNLAAVTVVDQSAAYADGMATALLVLGPEAGLALAEETGIAGYFLARGPEGIEEKTTTFFETLARQ